MVFHESLISGPEYPSQRSELLKSIFTYQDFGVCPFYTENAEKILNEFLCKFKSIDDSNIIFTEVFGRERILRPIVKQYINAPNSVNELKILNIFLSCTLFL